QRSLGRRSPCRCRRGQWHRLADRDRRLFLGADRSHRRRRPGEPRGPDRSGIEPCVPAAPNRARAELRAVDAVRRLRVRGHVSVSACGDMNHYLSIILFEPLVGALLLVLMSKKNEDAIRWIANITAFVG